MKLYECMIWGDLSSDRASEQYPTVPICSDCIEQDEKELENHQILSVGVEIEDNDLTCEFCDYDPNEE